VDIYEIIRPSLTLLDGIVGMEGNGPNKRPPNSIGIDSGQRGFLSLDQIVCDLLGILRESLLTNRVRLNRGWEEIDRCFWGER